MSTDRKDASTKPLSHPNNQANQVAQDVQPESACRLDAQDEELRQSSPNNPRVSDKSLEATEEA